MNGNKVLILLAATENDFWKLEMQKRDVDVDITVKSRIKLLRIIRKIHMLYNLPFQAIWFGNWKERIKAYDTVIIYAAHINICIVKWIHRFHPAIRIIVWYSNPVIDCVLPSRFPSQICEYWTFDINDSTKYNMKFNNQYYFSNISIKKSKILYDLIFIGKDKGRYEKLSNLKMRFDNLKLKSYIYIVTDNVNKKHKNHNLREYNELLSYHSILELISESKVIIDYNQEGQSGQTLRPFRSIIF